ncbi:MAG: DUF3102 domain-containing protein [Bradyrhizobium sp.]|nr:DUF3102 domain-containing protein [Bradyrhizobium sp.]
MSAPVADDVGHGHLVRDRFNYDVLTDDLATTLRASAGRILRLTSTATETIMEIGRELILAREQIDHGGFELWIEHELSIGMRTAQNYMSVARLADDQGKSATVALLPPSTAYRLAAKSTPAEIRDYIIRRAEVGEIVTDGTVRDMITKKKSNKKVLIQRTHSKAEHRKKSKKIREREVREHLERQARERLREEKKDQTASSIVRKLGRENVATLLEEIGTVDDFIDFWEVIKKLKIIIGSSEATP